MISPVLSITASKLRSRSMAVKNADGIILPFTPSTTGFSVGFWWRPHNISQDHALFNWESTFDRNGISFRQNSGGALAVVGSNAAGTVFVLTNGSNEVPGVWTHLTLTYNSSHAIKIYKFASQILSGSGTITTNGTLPALGKRSFTNSMFAIGLFKNITFQNTDTAWSSAQITELKERNIVPNGAVQWPDNANFSDLNGLNKFSIFGSPNFMSNVPSQFN